MATAEREKRTDRNLRVISHTEVVTSVLPLYDVHMGTGPHRDTHPFPVHANEGLQITIGKYLGGVECVVLMKTVVGQVQTGGRKLNFRSDEFRTNEIVYVDPLVISKAQAEELIKMPDHTNLLDLDDLLGMFKIFDSDVIVFTKEGWIKPLRPQDSVIYTSSEGVEIKPFTEGSIVDYIKLRKELLAERKRRRNIRLYKQSE